MVLPANPAGVRGGRMSPARNGGEGASAAAASSRGELLQVPALERPLYLHRGGENPERDENASDGSEPESELGRIGVETSVAVPRAPSEVDVAVGSTLSGGVVGAALSPSLPRALQQVHRGTQPNQHRLSPSQALSSPHAVTRPDELVEPGLAVLSPQDLLALHTALESLSPVTATRTVIIKCKDKATPDDFRRRQSFPSPSPAVPAGGASSTLSEGTRNPAPGRLLGSVSDSTMLQISQALSVELEALTDAANSPLGNSILEVSCSPSSAPASETGGCSAWNRCPAKLLLLCATKLRFLKLRMVRATRRTIVAALLPFRITTVFDSLSSKLIIGESESAEDLATAASFFV